MRCKRCKERRERMLQWWRQNSLANSDQSRDKQNSKTHEHTATIRIESAMNKAATERSGSIKD
jgi:hypothetical protein